jgi:glycosyltransferase involved in cell wall biosynthesis
VDESTGILVERGNPKSIARGIDQMVRDLKKGRFENKTIRESASKYSIDEIMSQFLDLAED